MALMPLFQSSPTAEGGRDPRYGSPCHRCGRWFQSSPTAEGGRDALRLSSPCQDSFNPRPPLRVGATRRSSPSRSTRRRSGFNPRPPLRVGATLLRAAHFDAAS